MGSNVVNGGVGGGILYISVSWSFPASKSDVCKTWRSLFLIGSSQSHDSNKQLRRKLMSQSSCRSNKHLISYENNKGSNSIRYFFKDQKTFWSFNETFDDKYPMSVSTRPSPRRPRSAPTPRSRRSWSDWRRRRHRWGAVGRGWSCDPDSSTPRSAPARGTRESWMKRSHARMSSGSVGFHRLTWEYRHFWHLMLIGRGRSGSSLRSSDKMIDWTSSLSRSKCSRPNGTLVWTTRDGPRPGASEGHRHGQCITFL